MQEAEKQEAKIKKQKTTKGSVIFLYFPFLLLYRSFLFSLLLVSCLFASHFTFSVRAYPSCFAAKFSFGSFAG